MGSQPGDEFRGEQGRPPEPDEVAEKRAAEAMAEKLRREADRFLHRRPGSDDESRPRA